ncbi:hypothetical protein [uncultured Corynebacterium sp.]|uniref:hypothetical protein n=1 Tax=uncultured Corynebacterium sp. TaxID=159447 RepID=UPI0025F8CAD2|nr:hypothetical protein [uncultured Corynebacterium sp.]
MKRTLAAGALSALTLTLAACGGDGEEGTAPDARTYGSMSEWKEAVGGTGLGCEWLSSTTAPSEVDEYATCTDKYGARASLATFSSEGWKNQRINQFRNQQSWAEEAPAMVDGPGWTVDCANEAQAQRWIDAIGGQLRLAPNY